MPGFELFDETEKNQISDVLNSGIYMRYGFDNMRNGHWKAKELENKISQVLDIKHVHLTSSGTTALTTALAIVGVGYGDEVILPCFTFVATVEAVISVGAIPIFAEIDDSLTLCPNSVQKLITPQTKCVMPVHMCGSMANMNVLKEICNKNNLLLIEDAAQSFGGSYDGKALGSIGDVGAFSFDFVKTITCAEGGAVVTNNSLLGAKADAFTDHGHDHLGLDRGADNHPFIGLNFRISELHAAVGLAQIEKLPKILSIQKNNYSLLENILKQSPHVSFRKIWDTNGNTHTFLAWMLPTQQLMENFIGLLKQRNLLAGNFYWYANNWHFIKQWQHIYQAQSLFGLNPPQLSALKNINPESYIQTNAILSKTLCTAISLKWSENDIEKKGQEFLQIINEIC